MLGMEAGPWYHTGIRRDPDDITTWRRAGDGKAVELSPDGWSRNYPRSDPGWIYLRWEFNIGSDQHNTVYNFYDRSVYFICESVLVEF